MALWILYCIWIEKTHCKKHMPILKSETGGTLKILEYNHTHNILQKWLAPTIVLNVSLQNYNTSSSTVSNLVAFSLSLFWDILMHFEEKKKYNPNWKVKWWKIVHFFCVVILCDVDSHTQKKKTLSWQLNSAIRYAVLGNPSLGGWSGYFTRVVSTTCSTIDKIPPW